MTLCEKCIHEKVCAERDCYDEADERALTFCSYHKPKSRFVELPCEVGQTVYVPWCYAFQRGIAIVEVKEIKLYDTNPSHCMFLIDMESDNECFNQSFGGWKTEQSIGKTVFLSREDAEKALKERERE